MTRTLLPLLLLLSACSTGTIKLADDTAGGVTEDDTATAADDTAGDSDTVEEEPVLVPDYSVWDATRRFYYDYSDYGYECDETVVELGDAVDEGTSTYDALHELCGLCDYFYEVTPDRDSACDGIIGLGTTWRGVILEDDAAAVYLYRENNGGVEEYASDENAGFDGTTIEYGYTYQYYGWIDIEVTGGAVYPLVEQE